MEGYTLSLPLQQFSQSPSPVHVCMHTPNLPCSGKQYGIFPFGGQTAAHLGRERTCIGKAFLWQGKRTPSPNAKLLIQIVSAPQAAF